MMSPGRRLFEVTTNMDEAGRPVKMVPGQCRATAGGSGGTGAAAFEQQVWRNWRRRARRRSVVIGDQADRSRRGRRERVAASGKFFHAPCQKIDQPGFLLKLRFACSRSALCVHFAPAGGRCKHAIMRLGRPRESCAEPCRNRSLQFFQASRSLLWTHVGSQRSPVVVASTILECMPSIFICDLQQTCWWRAWSLVSSLNRPSPNTPKFFD